MADTFTKSNEQKIRHGQALAMQWVAFALQKLSLDADSGGEKSGLLLGYQNSVDKTDGFKTLAIGCNYVIGFVLPLAIELALKSFIAKENSFPPKIHNLSKLFAKISSSSRNKIERKYAELTDNVDINSFSKLLGDHSNDFEDWRYLDNAEILKREEIKLQYSLSAILEVYNQ